MHIPHGTIYRRTLFRMRILTDRTALIQAVDRMDRMGGFARQLGQAALLADQENLRKLVMAFPEYFIEGHGLRLIKNERYDHILEGQRHQRGESGDIRGSNRRSSPIIHLGGRSDA